jgi:hypothetical protein
MMLLEKLIYERNLAMKNRWQWIGNRIFANSGTQRVGPGVFEPIGDQLVEIDNPEVRLMRKSQQAEAALKFWESGQQTSAHVWVD